MNRCSNNIISKIVHASFFQFREKMEKKQANTSAHHTSILLKPISTPGMIVGTTRPYFPGEEKGARLRINLLDRKGRRSPGRYFFLLSSVSRLKRKIPTQRTPEERELLIEYHKDIFFGIRQIVAGRPPRVVFSLN
jgi:hypothetical protein